MPSLSFPTTAEINHIVRNTIVDPTKFRGNAFAPMATAYAERIQVDVINAIQGITPPHALNADAKVATLSGQGTLSYATGYWRETYRINEEELLYARQEGTFNERAGRLRVVRRANELNVRLDTRIEQLRWSALINGQIAVKDNGVDYTVNMNIPASNKMTFDWISNAEEDIVADIAALTELYFGTGAKIDTIWMNYDIAKAFASNAQLKTLLQQSVFATNLSASNVGNALHLLFPQINFEVYTEGYGDGNGNFVPFIPLGTFAVTGKGSEIGMDFCTTLALQNGGVDNPQPGKFSAVIDKSENATNPHVDVTVGINGLPRMHHPNWFISGTAS